MTGLGLAHLTALELSPPALVKEAARAGFTSVGLRAPGEGCLPLGSLPDALPADARLSVEMPMPTMEVRARIAVAFEATKRLLDRQPRGTMRPSQRREGRGQIQRQDTT